MLVTNDRQQFVALDFREHNIGIVFQYRFQRGPIFGDGDAQLSFVLRFNQDDILFAVVQLLVANHVECRFQQRRQDQVDVTSFNRFIHGGFKCSHGRTFL